MVYLHENREKFTNAVNLASEYFHILPIIAVSTRGQTAMLGT